MNVGDIAFVGIGFYSDQKIRIDYIDKHKKITSNGKRYTQVSGTLLKNDRRINCILEFLFDSSKLNYTKLSKFDLIKLIVKKDTKAKKEYIIRYKKLPKINMR